MAARTAPTKTGGREATTGVIPGDFALSVGMPDTQAPRGWKWTLLTAVARLETGHTPSRNYPEYWDGDVPWVGIKDATGNHGRTIDDTLQHTTQAGIDNSSARVLPAHTVCLSRTASVGYVIVMGRPMATSQDFVNWVCSNALDYRYLKYVLLAERRSFLRFASGTTHQTIYFPEVKAFHVCLPPLPEQRAIAGVLGALDDKIEVNRKQARVLEGIARAVFTSWFVDFDPVRRAAAGQPTGLPPDLAALFPKHLVDSPIDEVPEGWRVGTIKDFASRIQYGLTQRASVDPIGPRFLRITDVQGGRVDWKTVPYCAASEDDFKKYQIVEGDILVARTGASTGENIYILDPPAAVFASYLVRFRFAESATARIVAEFMRTENYFSFVKSALGGSAQPNANAQILAAASLVLPPAPIAAAFHQLIRPLDLKRVANNAESATLAALRDALLPKLISGELRIADAETIVQRAS